MTPPPVPDPSEPQNPLLTPEVPAAPAAQPPVDAPQAALEPVAPAYPSPRRMATDMLSMPDLADTFDEPTLVGLRQKQKLFEGRFELQQKLGSGGMGQVWRALDGSLGEEVALKFLPPFLQDDPIAVEELKRETKNGRRLSHPNIVKIHGLQMDERSNHVAVEMEFVDGQTLGQLRVQKPNLVFEASELTPVISQLLSALAYAHEEAGLVHRDLKPANLMLTRDGKLKITDFGISRTLADGAARATIQGRSAGTLCYMSPEQALGGKASASDDIYALASTLYDLLTGRPPFYQGNIAQQLTSSTAPAIAARRAEFQVQSREPIPDAWESAIARCLSKSAEVRPQSMRELAALFGITLDSATSRPQPQPTSLGAGLNAPMPTGFASHTSALTTPPSPPPLSTLPAVPTRGGGTPTVTITAARDQLRPVNDLAREHLTGSGSGSASTSSGSVRHNRKSPILLIAIASLTGLAVIGGAGVFLWKSIGEKSVASGDSNDKKRKQDNDSDKRDGGDGKGQTKAEEKGAKDSSLPREMPDKPKEPQPPPAPELTGIAKLKALIDASPAGQPVMLPAGTYKGTLLLKEGQQASAESLGQVTIESGDRNQPALIIKGGKGTRCNNLIFRFSVGAVTPDMPRTELANISGEAELENCEFTQAIGDAVLIAGSGAVKLTDCKITEARYCGLLTQAGGTVTLENLSVSGVGESAIDLRNSGTKATINKAMLELYKFTGIVIRDGAQAVISDSKVIHHDQKTTLDPASWAQVGIAVNNKGSLRITNSSIERNQKGIVADTEGLCEATGVICQNNTDAGIWLRDANPASKVIKCTIQGSDCGLGMSSTSGGQGPQIEECVIKQNVFGIYIQGPAFAPLVLRNQVLENANIAISLTNCAGTFQGNILRGNGSDVIDQLDTTSELRIQ